MLISEFSEKIRKLDAKISTARAELAAADLCIDDISPALPDGMPRSFTGHVSKKVENAAIENVMRKDKLHAELDACEKERAELIALLDGLPAAEYGVIYRICVLRMTELKCARDMGYSTRQVRRYKARGGQFLKKI